MTQQDTSVNPVHFTEQLKCIQTKIFQHIPFDTIHLEHEGESAKTTFSKSITQFK